MAPFAYCDKWCSLLWNIIGQQHDLWIKSFDFEADFYEMKIYPILLMLDMGSVKRMLILNRIAISLTISSYQRGLERRQMW
jgi:hypothetical protein